MQLNREGGHAKITWTEEAAKGIATFIARKYLTKEMLEKLLKDASESGDGKYDYGNGTVFLKTGEKGKGKNSVSKKETYETRGHGLRLMCERTSVATEDQPQVINVVGVMFELEGGQNDSLSFETQPFYNIGRPVRAVSGYGNGMPCDPGHDYGANKLVHRAMHPLRPIQ